MIRRDELPLIRLIAGIVQAQKAPAGYSQADYERGGIDAQNDSKSGLLAYEFAGLPAPSDDEESRLFRERYHIEFRRVAGDEIRIEAISHMIGYNEIALPKIERRFGKDILQKVGRRGKSELREEPG